MNVSELRAEHFTTTWHQANPRGACPECRREALEAQLVYEVEDYLASDVFDECSRCGGDIGNGTCDCRRTFDPNHGADNA